MGIVLNEVKMTITFVFAKVIDDQKWVLGIFAIGRWERNSILPQTTGKS